MNPHEPLETVSVVAAAANRLRDSLFAGDYLAGEEIKDTKLSHAYGIARPTARLAVQQLVAEGMLIRPPGHSARVRTFTVEEVDDLYGVRKLIELESIRRIREGQLPLDAIGEALQRLIGLRETEDDWSRIAEADVAFHRAVVDSARSARLRAYFATLSSETRLLIALLREQYSHGEALYQEHEELFELLSGRGSMQQLETAWRSHLDAAQRFLVTHLGANARVTRAAEQPKELG